MNSNTSKLNLLIWSGPVGIALVAIGFFVLAGFLPPPSPALQGSELVAYWSQGVDLKRTGLMLCVWGGILYVPFTTAIGLVLRKAEDIPVMSIAQAALGTYGTVFFSVNFFVLMMAPYRIGNGDSSYLQILSDLGFSMTFFPVQPFTLQYIAIALGILLDKSNNPIFPRWMGYTNLWVAVLFLPACFIPYVKTGPLAWNGLFSFWIPVFVFMVWYVVMFWGMRKAIKAPPFGNAIDAT